MDSRTTTLALIAVAAAALVVLPKLKRRFDLSRAKHRSLSGHPRIAKLVAALVPSYEYDTTRFFRSDGAPEQITARRHVGFTRLADLFRTRFPETRRCTREVIDSISDLQFTDAYRVPFQYSRIVREHLGTGALVQSSSG